MQSKCNWSFHVRRGDANTGKLSSTIGSSHSRTDWTLYLSSFQSRTFRRRTLCSTPSTVRKYNSVRILRLSLIFFCRSGSEGQLYNYWLNASSSPPEYKVFQVDTTGKGDVLATITDAPAAYLHSVFSTENYVLLIIWQADYNSTRSKQFENIADSLNDWNPNRKALFCKFNYFPGYWNE